MTTDDLRGYFERAGVGFLFAEQPDRMAEALFADLSAIEAEYQRRYGQPANLPARVQEHERVLEPFFQALAHPMSTAMRVMVLRMTEGATVLELDYRYVARDSSFLRVRILGKDGQTDTFESDDLWDAEVLRHFGMMKMHGKPILDGYYALWPAPKP